MKINNNPAPISDYVSFNALHSPKVSENRKESLISTVVLSVIPGGGACFPTFFAMRLASQLRNFLRPQAKTLVPLQSLVPLPQKHLSSLPDNRTISITPSEQTRVPRKRPPALIIPQWSEVLQIFALALKSRGHK